MHSLYVDDLKTQDANSYAAMTLAWFLWIHTVRVKMYSLVKEALIVFLIRSFYVLLSDINEYWLTTRIGHINSYLLKGCYSETSDVAILFLDKTYTLLAKIRISPRSTTLIYIDRATAQEVVTDWSHTGVTCLNDSLSIIMGYQFNNILAYRLGEPPQKFIIPQDSVVATHMTDTAYIDVTATKRLESVEGMYTWYSMTTHFDTMWKWCTFNIFCINDNNIITITIFSMDCSYFVTYGAVCVWCRNWWLRARLQ